MPVRHETVRRPPEAAQARPLLKRPSPAAPQRLLNLPATARAAIIKTMAGPIKKIRATRQAVPMPNRLPELPRRGRRTTRVPLLTPSRLGGGDVPRLVRTAPGILARLRIIPVRARRLEGPQPPEGPPPLGLRRLRRATTATSGQAVGEVAVPVPGDGRITRPQQGIRHAAAAVTRPETPVGIEGVAPTPKEREGPQALRALYGPHPTNVVAATGIIRGVSQAAVPPQAKVVAVRTAAVAHAEAAAHLLRPLHREELAPRPGVQGAGRPPVVAKKTSSRPPVAAGVTEPLPVPDPSAVQTAPLDPQGDASSRHAGPQAGAEGPPLERRLSGRGQVRAALALHPGDAGAETRPVADEPRPARPLGRARETPSPRRTAASAAAPLPRTTPEGQALPRPVRRL